MKTPNLFKVALTAIVRNKMRSFLTMLGIIIGVASVVALVSLGSGAQADIEGQIQDMGTNMVIVVPGSSNYRGVSGGGASRPTLSMEDVGLLRQDASSLADVSPVVESSEQVIAGGGNWSTKVSGVDPEYLDIRNWEVSSGRFFNEKETKIRSKVAVLGQTVVTELFGDEDPVGRQVRIRNVPFTFLD